jgi:threonine/homoserine/homoserine lactone efflux protein
MTAAVFLGALLGFLVNIPLGPINAAAITHALRERLSRGMAIGIGAAVMDTIYCAAAMFGVSLASDSIIINVVLQLAAFALMIFTGLSSFRKVETVDDLERREREAEERVQKRFGVKGPFLMGVLMYLAYPPFLPMWLFISGFLQKHGFLVGTPINYVAFSFGVGGGTALWFYGLLSFLIRRREHFSNRLLNTIHRIAGIALLVFSTYLGYRILIFTNWLLLWQALGLA